MKFKVPEVAVAALRRLLVSIRRRDGEISVHSAGSSRLTEYAVTSAEGQFDSVSYRTIVHEMKSPAHGRTLEDNLRQSISSARGFDLSPVLTLALRMPLDDFHATEAC